MENMPAVYISQKIELWEALSGCEFPNEYLVYPADVNGNLDKVKPALFHAYEKSNCLARMILPGDCRGY